LLDVPEDFRGRVMNVHPSLIPAFCGKGYYGHHVHEAVLAYGAKVSGCTVHFADNEYDHGPIIVQRPVPVRDEDTPATLAARVFEQECEAYPEAVRLFAEGRLRIEGRIVRKDEG
jgi:phosphoribosylglycinamide formyltransferase 1